jgi:hypothetical protein
MGVWLVIVIVILPWLGFLHWKVADLEMYIQENITPREDDESDLY